jgi:two-component sensor histidine kinase
MRLTARIEKIETSPAYQERRNEARRRELAHKMMNNLKTVCGMSHDEARAYLISQRVRAGDIDATS